MESYLLSDPITYIILTVIKYICSATVKNMVISVDQHLENIIGYRALC